MFYTALWHTLLLPRVAMDNDGEYLNFDGSHYSVYAKDYIYYDDFSTWDIYRALVPLHSLVHTDIIVNMVHSLVKKAEQGNWLPIFPGTITEYMISSLIHIE
jgi:putative alpha-1,2-mannosidase